MTYFIQGVRIPDVGRLEPECTIMIARLRLAQPESARVGRVWGWRAPPFPPRAERLARPTEPALSRAEPALCSREVFAGRVGVGVGERGDTSRSAQGKEAMV